MKCNRETLFDLLAAALVAAFFLALIMHEFDLWRY